MVSYLSFIVLIANDSERFVTQFQSMKPKVHIPLVQMFRLVRTLMIKFVKSKLLMEEKDSEKIRNH